MKNNEVLKYGLILFIITAISTAIVASAYEITRQSILPSAKSFEKIEGDFGSEIKEVYKGLDADKVVGYTIKTAPKGYGGEVETITAITSVNKISGVSIGTMSETPGLGAKSKDKAFIGQYKDKDAKVLKVIKNGTPKDNEIVAIAGATITSDAVTRGVNQSIKLFDEQLNR